MFYYKNIDISKQYGISATTVTAWIENALTSKNNLTVEKVEGKFRVLVNSSNDLELKRLAEEGQKYKNVDSVKKWEITGDFYDIFSPNEVLDIARNLEYKNLLNLKYSYAERGAKLWDDSYHAGSSPIHKCVEEFTKDINQVIIDEFGQTPFNLVDLGAGNAYPIKPILEANQVKSYTAIDISSELLEIATKNAKKWKPDIEFGSYCIDLETDRLSKTLSDIKGSYSERNVVAYLGSTINNHDNRLQVIQNIASGLEKGDLFVFSFTLDNPEQRIALNYNKNREIIERQIWWIRMLGIDADSCNYDLFYDPVINSKVKNLKLDKDYVLTFDIEGKKREVRLSTTQAINIWKHYLISMNQINDELTQAGLKIISLKVDSSRSYGLVVCEV